MSTLAIKFDDHAVDVSFTKTSLHFVLADGREILAPLEWFPRLRDATDAERKDWRFIGMRSGYELYFIAVVFVCYIIKLVILPTEFIE